MSQVFGALSGRYFTYDGLLLSTPSMVIRFGAFESFQLTRTAWPVRAQASVTPLGVGSEEQAVSAVAPHRAARTVDKTARTLTISPHPTSQQRRLDHT